MIDEVACRICLETTEISPALVAPCRCSGTQLWVHRVCLDQWRFSGNKNTTHCDICRYKFQYESDNDNDDEEDDNLLLVQMVRDWCWVLLHQSEFFHRFLFTLLVIYTLSQFLVRLWIPFPSIVSLLVVFILLGSVIRRRVMHDDLIIGDEDGNVYAWPNLPIFGVLGWYEMMRRAWKDDVYELQRPSQQHLVIRDIFDNRQDEEIV